MYKRHKLVILPTNKKAKLYLDKQGIYTKNRVDGSILRHNIYILSDEEIKEGDWVLHKNAIYQVRINKGLYLTLEGLEHIDVRSDLCKKIIATTDESLKISKFSHFSQDLTKVSVYKDCILPQIPQSFIEYFVSEYNKGNIITEVKVEYKDYSIPGGVKSYISNTNEIVDISCKLLINQDNTINIKPIKDSWNRKEIIEIFNKMFATDIIDANVKKVDFDKWIDLNI